MKCDRWGARDPRQLSCLVLVPGPCVSASCLPSMAISSWSCGVDPRAECTVTGKKSGRNPGWAWCHFLLRQRHGLPWEETLTPLEEAGGTAGRKRREWPGGGRDLSPGQCCRVLVPQATFIGEGKPCFMTQAHACLCPALRTVTTKISPKETKMPSGFRGYPESWGNEYVCSWGVPCMGCLRGGWQTKGRPRGELE